MYYPKSQIICNLYTNGEEFIIQRTNQPYIGYYWKSSNGKLFTGKTPQDPPINELVEIKNFTFQSDTYFSTTKILPQLHNLDYIKINNQDVNKEILIPYYSPVFPTQQNYQVGEFRRYFCKKTNEIIYLEINIETYSKLVSKDPQILWQLYQPFNLPWQLTGKKEDVYKANKNITELTSVKQNLPMLSEYLKNDFTKYYK